MPKTTDNRLTIAQIFSVIPREKRNGKHYCPLCKGWYLTVNQKTADFSCKNAAPCSATEIAAHIWAKIKERDGKPPKERKAPTGNGLTLAEYAAAKRLDPEWLASWFYLYDEKPPKSYGWLKGLGCAVALPYYKPARSKPVPDSPGDYYSDSRGELVGTKWRWGWGKDEREFQKDGHAYLYAGRFLGMLETIAVSRGTLKYLFVVEGESNTQTLWRAGYAAVGVSGTAWKPEYAELECFKRAACILVVQDQKDGKPAPEAVAFVKKVAADFPSGKVRALLLPRGTKDVSDLWIESEDDAFSLPGTESLFEHDLNLAVQEAAPVDPPISPTVATVEDPTPHLVPFPADIGAEVFDACPILKDFVDRVLPHVEADANILTADFLACAGSVVGGRVFAPYAYDKHAPPTFHLTIAGTGVGKGVALNAAEVLFRPVDAQWYTILSRSCRSGQALVRLLKEASEPMILRENKDGGLEPVENPKYTHGRMLLCYSEMASLFGSMKIKESVLSPYLRDAYDGKPLANEKGAAGESIAAFNEPYTLAVLGNITPWELRQYLGAAEFANGLANRFVWWASQQSKRLARSPRAPDLSDLSARICALFPTNPPTNPIRLDFSADADTEWEKWVAGLPYDDGTPLASACARMRPNALRLAVLFAVLDESRLTLQGTPLEIDAPHVRAAAAIMERHRASVEWYLSQTPAASTAATASVEKKIARVRDLATVNGGRFTGAQLYRLFSHGTQAERESIAVAAGFEKEPGATEKGHTIAVWVPARTQHAKMVKKGVSTHNLQGAKCQHASTRTH